MRKALSRLDEVALYDRALDADAIAAHLRAAVGRYDIYSRLSEWGYTHETVCHAAGEFAQDDDSDGFCEVHVNTLEGFWSLLRSWLRPHRGRFPGGTRSRSGQQSPTDSS